MTTGKSQVGLELDEAFGIPVIDLSKCDKENDLVQRMAMAKQLVSACRRVGLVYIVNHGVDADRVTQAFEWSKNLFDLKHEDKMKAPHPNGPAVHRGYSYPGLEKVSQVLADGELQNGNEEVHKELRQVSDCKESYDIGSEINPDQPNVWLPEETLPGFQAFMSRFYEECNEAVKRIFRVLALGIGLSDEEYLVKLHSGVNNQLRLLHYPAIPARELESGTTVRMPAHSDWSSLTMLFQDDTGGLEFEDPRRPGTFMAAKPLRNALVMNVGDLLMRWSNDFLTSTLHRVTLPPLDETPTSPVPDADRIARERYSIVYFVAPEPDVVVECLPTCIDARNPAKYEPITQRDYGRIRAAYHYETKPSEVEATAMVEG